MSNRHLLRGIPLLLAVCAIAAAAPNISPNSLPAATVGTSYSQTLTVSGQRNPVVWFISSGSLPPGLNFGAGNGNSATISGTPTTAGSYSFSVRVVDSNVDSDTQAYTMVVNPAPPAVATSSLPAGTIAVPYSATLEATGGSGGYTWSRTGGSLPAGLNLAADGTISGTPTTAGISTFTVTVRDSGGRTASRSLSITIEVPPLTITTTSLPNGTVGTSYAQSLTATGGSGTYTWSRTAGSLPGGLSLNGSGAISGTPTSAGAFPFTVRVSDTGGRTATADLSITVAAAAPTPPSVTTASLPGGQVGAQYSQTLAASGGSGGYTWSLTSGTLPAGLTLTPAGAIGGTPSAAGTSPFTVTVQDSAGLSGSKQLSIAVSPAALTVTTESVSGGQVGAQYSQTVEASGGTPPYSWAVTAGGLPAGLTMNGAGAIAGTPTAAGTFGFTVTATDSANRTASKQLSIVVAPALTIGTSSLPGGVVGTAYTATLTATGGGGGYTWAVSSGALPAGLTLNPSGAISGTPSAAGTANFTVQVTDSAKRTATSQLSIAVASALTVSTASLPGGTVGTAYSANLEATGGSGGYRWTSTGALPAGVTLSAAGAISGTPTAAGTATFTATVTDSANRTATKQLSIAVEPALTITTASLPGGVVGTAYSATLTATGGSGTGYTFTVADGALPAGLTLTPAGAITGTPSAGGTANFTVQVTDSANRTATKQLSIAIVPALTVTTASLPGGVVGAAYSGALEASGGSGSGYTFAIASGALPAGLTLSPAGAISGTPSAAGAATFTVRVTDSASRTATKQLSIAIDATLTVTTPSLPNGIVGTAYSATLQAAGGSGGFRWAVTGGALPAGLTLAADGAITGTPTTAGTATFTVTATDSSGRPTSKPLSIVIEPAVAVTTASLPAATVGVAYTQSLAASGGSGGYTWSVTSGSLPAGLTLSPAGAISGTPTTAGTREFAVTATDSGSRTASKTLSIAVNPPGLTITTAALPPGTVGAQYSQALAATGGSGGNVWSVSAGSLPAGLALSTGGVIAGVPTTAGTSNFTALVKDSANVMATRQFSVVIAPTTLVITTQSLPPAVQGAAYTQTLAATGGTGGYRWSVAEGALPTGLALEPAGRVAGTATGGSSTFTLAVSDNAGVTVTRTLSITVNPPLSLPPAASLPTGVTGTTYTGSVAPTGGQAPYTFAVTTGQLPPGLSLDTRTGAITGRPSQVGEFTFAIQARDAANTQTQASYTITVANTLTIVNPPVLPAGSVAVAYQVTLTAAGGTAPYSWSATAGALPGGVNFRPDGVIEGTPASAGSFQFTATVTDALGARISKEFTLVVAATLTITTGPQLPQGVPTTPYNATLAAVGGTPPFVWSVVSGSLPAGLRLEGATGAITGVPTGPTTANFTAAVTDSRNVTVQKAFTITVAPGVTFTSPATLPSATAGDAYTFTLAATGGTAPYAWRIVDGALPAGLAVNATTGIISGTPSDAGTFNFTVEAADASGLRTTRVHTLVVDLPTVATLRLTGVPATLAPMQQPQLELVIANPYPVAITGRLNLAFAPASGMPDDPAVQFSSGGRSAAFTIAANDTRATFSVPRLMIQSGSVAGTIQFSLESLRAGTTALPTPAEPLGTAQAPAAAAVVRTVEVRRTSGGFDLVVVGASNTRELANMTVRFRPPAGASLQTNEVTVDLAEAARGWFQGSGSTQYGGQFTITLPFSFVGGPSAIEAVSVVLTNRVGASQEATGPY